MTIWNSKVIGMWEIGVDEAGRGPVLGPLVVASCAIPREDIPLLKEIGVKDSKYLSSKRRKEIEEWFNEQSQTRGWKKFLVNCTPKRIDMALMADGLNWLEVRAFGEALTGLELRERVNITNDACDVNEMRFTQRISEQLQSWPWRDSQMQSFHKADEHYPIVSMASILAKEERDRCIAELASSIGQPIGSGYPSDPNTKKALPLFISDDGIHDDVRWGWATATRFWSENCKGDVPVRGAPRTVQHSLFDQDDASIS